MTPHLPPELIRHYNDCSTCWWNPETGYLETCKEGSAIMLREQDRLLQRDRKQESGEHRADSKGTSAPVVGPKEDGSCRICSAVPAHPDTGLCATCTDERHAEVAGGARIDMEVGNVLDHWEQVPNDLRGDLGYESLHNTLQKLYNAKLLAAASATTQLSEELCIHVDRDNPTQGWLMKRGPDRSLTALDYGKLVKLNALLRGPGREHAPTMAQLSEGQVLGIIYDALKNQFPAKESAMMVASCCAGPILNALLRCETEPRR